jgi:4-amino-4-deoxy-L-arabinose transferase-like glycosyltransferase
LKLEESEAVTPQVAGPVSDLAVAAGRTVVGRRAVPIARFLPILGLYIVVSLAVHAAHNDEPIYLLYARDLTTHGVDAALAWSYLWHGPALPVLLAPLVAVDAPLAVMRILVGPALLFTTVLVFHQMVRPYLGSERGAVIATYALGLYLPFLSIVSVIHVEPLATLCFTLAAFFLIRAFKGEVLDAVLAGVSLAVLALSRVEYGYVILAGLLLSGAWWLTSRRSVRARQSTLALGVALLLCTPWLAYTYSVTHKPFYWGDAGGLSLYWMTAPGNVGDWHLGKDTRTYPGLAVDRPVFAELNQLRPLQWDGRLMHVALNNIRRDPAHYVTNVVNNIARLLFNAPYSYENETTKGLSPPWGLMLYALPNAILLGLLSVALAVAIKARRRLRPEILPIGVLAILGFAVHVPVAAYGRFVIPLIPVVAWLVIAIIAPNVRVALEPSPPSTRP